MAWYVFDLDETLANTTLPHPFLCDLRPMHYYLDEPDGNPPNLSVQLSKTLDTIYSHFVTLVSQKEQGTHPIGILRPGIIDVFRMIQAQQTAGICKGVIMYSNNGNQAALEFIRDCIQTAVGGPPLFCELVGWNHPKRASEREHSVPGSALKTYNVLVDILESGPCQASLPNEQTIMFFDDLNHPDLWTHLHPVNHYIQVQPFTYYGSIRELGKCYIQAIRMSNIQSSPALFSEFHTWVGTRCRNKTVPGFKPFQQYISNIIKTHKNLQPLDKLISFSSDMIGSAIQRMGEEIILMNQTQTGGSRRSKRARTNKKKHTNRK
jgi:hypothetical protein